MQAGIAIKRAYEPWSRDDGYRVLVDRIWPRGLTREQLHVDLWLKEAAPSTGLRKWFGHDVSRWEGFQRRYLEELEANDAVVEPLRQRLREGPLTLVYGARDERHNQAVVLRDYLLGR